MRCPFCGQVGRDLFWLALHMDDDHRGRESELVVAIAEPAPLPIVRMPLGTRLPGVDIDAVHTTFGAVTRQEG